MASNTPEHPDTHAQPSQPPTEQNVITTDSRQLSQIRLHPRDPRKRPENLRPEDPRESSESRRRPRDPSESSESRRRRDSRESSDSRRRRRDSRESSESRRSRDPRESSGSRHQDPRESSERLNSDRYQGSFTRSGKIPRTSPSRSAFSNDRTGRATDRAQPHRPYRGFESAQPEREQGFAPFGGGAGNAPPSSARGNMQTNQRFGAPAFYNNNRAQGHAQLARRSGDAQLKWGQGNIQLDQRPGSSSSHSRGQESARFGGGLESPPPRSSPTGESKALPARTGQPEAPQSARGSSAPSGATRAIGPSPESTEIITGPGAVAAALPASMGSSAASEGLADPQHASRGVASFQGTMGGAATPEPASELPSTDREERVIALAIKTQKQFLIAIRQAQGAHEYTPCLNEFMIATKTNLAKLERGGIRERKQKQAALARRRSLDANVEYEHAKFQAQEAKARIDAAEEEARRLEQECAAMSDRSSREASPESASSVRSRSTPGGS